MNSAEPTGRFGAVEVTRISDIAGLLSIGDFWRSLDVHVFADMDNVLSNISNSGAKPQVFVLSKDSRPVALALGQEVFDRVSWKVGYLNIPKGPVRFLTFPPNSIVGAHDNETATALISAIDDCLAETRMAFCQFNQLDVRDPVYQTLKGNEYRWRRDPVNETSVHWKLELPDTFDAFRKSRSRKLKDHMNKYSKRVQKAFEDQAQLECLSRPEELDRAADIAESLTAKGYQRGLGIGFEDTPTQRDWWRLAANRGWLRIYVLTFEGQPAAFWSGTVYKGVYTTEFTSFDPEFKEFNPGGVALLRIIEELCSDPDVKKIDYGYGEGRTNASMVASAATRPIFFTSLALYVGKCGET